MMISAVGTALGAGAASRGAGKAQAASGASSSSSSSTVYDKKDANKDGTVSAIEELTYDLAHPSAQTGSLVNVTA